MRMQHTYLEFWAVHINGDQVNILHHCKGEELEGYFHVNAYVAGNNASGGEYLKDDDLIEQRRALRGKSPEDIQAFEDMLFAQSRELTVCGIDEKKNAMCYLNGKHDRKYIKSRAVARLFINGSGGMFSRMPKL